MRCVFLTSPALPGGTEDDGLARAALERLGWQVDVVSWRDAALGACDAAVIRSTWDYHHHLEAFLAVLANAEAAGSVLLNPLRLVSWNARKTYLRDLASRGISTVPTVWRERLAPGSLPGLFVELGAGDIVVKPVVSASADGAVRLDRRVTPERARDIENRFVGRALMAQPVALAILEEGEYSLIYLDGAFSHAVRKTPRPGDFRVQEEHGGMIRPCEPAESLRAAGDAVLAALPEVPLYARADIVRSNDGADWWLMELELIEPALYLGMHDGAPERFARVLDARFRYRAHDRRVRPGVSVKECR
jgi:glutathione synthase/RimK-type ligase-like ATP-grasp enzyme